MTHGKKPDGGRRRVSPRPYLIALLLIVGLPLLAYGAITWYFSEKRKAEECFTKPERVYDEIAGKCDGTFSGAVVSADGRLAVGWRLDPPVIPETRVFLFDLESGRELKHALLENVLSVNSVAISADGRRALLVSFGLSGGIEELYSVRVRVWNLDDDGGPRRLSLENAVVSAAAISPDGRCALLGRRDGSLTLLDLDGGKEIRGLVGHKDQVHSVVFSPDGSLALSLAIDGTICAWDIETGENIRTLSLSHSIEGGSGWRFMDPSTLAFSPDGKRVLISHGESGIWLCDIEGGKMLRKLQSVEGHTLPLAFSPDGRLALAGGRPWPPLYPLDLRQKAQATMWLWDVESGRLIRRFEFPDRKESFESGVSQVIFSPDGQCVLSVGEQQTTIPPGLFQGDFRPEIIRWRLPSGFGYRLLGTREEEKK